MITIIPVIELRKPDKQHRITIMRPGPDSTRSTAGTISKSHTVRQQVLLDHHEHMLRLDISDAILSICDQVEASSVPLGDLCFVNYGAQMSSREKALFGKDHVLRIRKESETCMKTVSGRNLYRYSVEWDGMYVEWALADQMYGSREPWFFETPKLMIRDITGSHRLELAEDTTKLYCDHTILCALRYCDIAIRKDVPVEAIEASSRFSLSLLTGLLASRVVSAYYYWKLTGEGVRVGGGFHTYPKTIRRLPVFQTHDEASHEQLSEISSLAERMPVLKRQSRESRTPDEKTRIDRRIAAADERIDELVYQLYGLSTKEIELIEEATQ